MLKSLAIFFLAGLCEIGGGYLVWLWLKADKPIWYSILGGLILTSYGVVATWQTENFARVYATYGGIFIIMALGWGYFFENYKPDKWDITGAIIAFFGVCVIMYMPRK